MRCRHCGSLLTDVFLDLGSAPPSNAFLRPEDLNAPETYFPLRLYTCSQCWLVQVDEVQPHDRLFAHDYVYHSSFSRSWLEHARVFVEQAVERLALGGTSRVIEIASNDGYLLQYVAARGIPCLGIEPTQGTAAVARSRGIETIVEFFGQRLAERLVAERGAADLVIANNVLAHVPDLNDFVAGLATLIAGRGVASIEFPHLQMLVEQNQFDTVYHEHFSYFSLHTVCTVFAAHGLQVFDIQRLPTHGGSLRVWAAGPSRGLPASPAVLDVLQGEKDAGMLDAAWYRGFQAKADAVKNELLEFLLRQHREGRRVAGYGAAAKGNTLLNYAGVRRDLLPYVVDASPHKQGRYLPGSRIAVVTESRLREERPDFVLVLPWNLRQEIMQQLSYIRDWGGRFVTAVPALCVE